MFTPRLLLSILVHEHPKELFRKLEAAGVNAISENQT
jgi:hypothetical protein